MRFRISIIIKKYFRILLCLSLYIICFFIHIRNNKKEKLSQIQINIVC